MTYILDMSLFHFMVEFDIILVTITNDIVTAMFWDLVDLVETKLYYNYV